MRLDGIIEFASVADAKTITPKGVGTTVTIAWQDSDAAIIWFGGKARIYTYEASSTLTPDDKNVIALNSGGFLVSSGGSGGVEQYPDNASLPVSGDAGILYIVNATVPASQYRWDTTTLSYVSLSDVPQGVIENTIGGSSLITDAGNYIVPNTGLSGDFVGHANQYAEFDGTAWTFTTPVNGDKRSILYGANAGNVYTYNAGVWTLSGTVISTIPSSFYDAAGTDKNIDPFAPAYRRRTGFTDFTPNFNPMSTIDTDNTYGLGYQVVASGNIGSFLDKAVYFLTQNNASQSATYQSASLTPRRIYTFVNTTSSTKNSMGAYTNLNGVVSTVLPAYTSITIQSTGSIWQQIDQSSLSVAPMYGAWQSVAPIIVNTVSLPTAKKPTVMVKDIARFRKIADTATPTSLYEVDYLYHATNLTGAVAGTGHLLITLPAGLTFNPSLYPFYTGAGVLSDSTMLAYAVPTSRISSASQNGYWGNDILVIPYNATQFRVFLQAGNYSNSNSYMSSVCLRLDYGSNFVIRLNFELEA